METSIKIIKFTTSFLLAFASIIIFTHTPNASAASADGQQLEVPQGSSASLNWSGYVAGGKQSTGQNIDQYTSVTGTWVVPTVSASSSAGATGSADATWVGIGGVKTRDLIQAGTQALVQDGTVTYSAWVETLPGFSKSVPLKISSGDSVTTTLTEQSAGEWLITITNNTTGTTYSRTVSYNSSLSSAEWVEEMVSNANGTFRPLDSFGSVTFTHAAATLNGTSENLSQLGAQPLQMVNSGKGQTLAVASALQADNASFTVARSTAAAVAAPASYAVRSVRTIHYRRGFTITFIRM